MDKTQTNPEKYNHTIKHLELLNQTRLEIEKQAIDHQRFYSFIALVIIGFMGAVLLETIPKEIYRVDFLDKGDNYKGINIHDIISTVELNAKVYIIFFSIVNTMFTASWVIVLVHKKVHINEICIEISKVCNQLKISNVFSSSDRVNFYSNVLLMLGVYLPMLMICVFLALLIYLSWFYIVFPIAMLNIVLLLIKVLLKLSIQT